MKEHSCHHDAMRLHTCSEGIYTIAGWLLRYSVWLLGGLPTNYVCQATKTGRNDRKKCSLHHSLAFFSWSDGTVEMERMQQNPLGFYCAFLRLEWPDPSDLVHDYAFLSWFKDCVAYVCSVGFIFVEGSGRCSLFSRQHVQTFDGVIYEFPGDCSYMLAGDCQQRSFSILGKSQSHTQAYTSIKQMSTFPNSADSFIQSDLLSGNIGSCVPWKSKPWPWHCCAKNFANISRMIKCLPVCVYIKVIFLMERGKESPCFSEKSLSFTSLLMEHCHKGQRGKRSCECPTIQASRFIHINMCLWF